MNSYPEYYAPYDSGDESDTDMSSDMESDTKSEIESDSEDPRIRFQEDPRYVMQKITGPSFNKPSLQIQNSKNSYQEWDSNTDIDSYKDHVYLDPPKTVKTSLISIKSINRDRSVYPSPYYFQLKLPRVYKHVVKFQLVQMSFPNGNIGNLSQADVITDAIKRDLIFGGIPSSCTSTCVGTLNCTGYTTSAIIVEKGRLNMEGEPLTVGFSIDDTRMTQKQMASELTFKANSTPPFNIISYDDFRDIFMNTRDISILFNEPGDSFYSDASNIRYNQHTKMDIMNTYYSQFDIDRYPEITEKIAFNAYYYPILKEAIATKRAEPFIQTGNLSYANVIDIVLVHFDGLDSDIYFNLCTLNRGVLDIYRRNHTFQHRNINKYVFTYDQSKNESRALYNTLHPSLYRELTNRLSIITEQQLGLHFLNYHIFQQMKTNLNNNNAIYKHLERNLSTILGNYHFVTNYSYNGGQYHSTSQSTFDAISDLANDNDFNSMFSYTSCIGGIFNNYNGTIMTFNTFMDYHSTMSSYYFMIQSTNIAISSINGKIYSHYHSYISTKYNDVFPKSMIDNRNYITLKSLPVSFLTDEPVYIPGGTISPKAIPYDETNCYKLCCSSIRGVVKRWYSCLPTNLVINSLQYRLGVINIIPNTINILSTLFTVTSTGNTNLFMQVNEEQGFNNMDVTMSENYHITNETTGQVKLFCAKILMEGVGDQGLSQTVIQNPTIFDTPLGKLDKLNIKIYYDDQTLTPAWLFEPFNLDITEWTATYQIDEEVSFANRQSGWGFKPTIPIPEDPDKIQLLAVTHKDNPNNS
jgi:hypothetical protein